ncbi:MULTISPECIES: hypothetical protein [Limnospira]|uniref:hypothetical protein n=1 Tax=Limnospira TaxID=2596745 RepID=UPI00144987F7|nr:MULTISPECIES: hypothetical protein [unclassified Limnospira]MDT9187105.1 hypothetical protein [Limnospira sp. PMC 894.15]MDT9233202.1 hypothetical protein [Limnospira sp. PMC 917.15]MDY7051910.1 hypothetical protein [Limnospira fusiformis LS22]QJB26041.1 type II toxin-antitoxin system VapC family toxin [Limnospira fusiformis SAG 85.79]
MGLSSRKTIGVGGDFSGRSLQLQRCQKPSFFCRLGGAVDANIIVQLLAQDDEVQSQS